MSVRTYTLQRGTQQRNVLVMATDTSGAPASGLDPESLRAAYVRDDGNKASIRLVPGSAGQWDAGGLVEVDPELVPGLYQFGVPDEVLASGAARAAVVITGGGVRFDPIEFDIVAFDPQEPERIGMEALAFESRLRCLTTAFPLLAVEEQKRLAEREQLRRERA